MSKKEYECSVHGVIIVAWNLSGICSKSGVTVSNLTRCLAHGNKRCEHKVEINKQAEDK